LEHNRDEIKSCKEGDAAELYEGTLSRQRIPLINGRRVVYGPMHNIVLGTFSRTKQTRRTNK
jgi:hypothetical protein